VPRNDPAFKIDRNPHAVAAHTLSLNLPREPTVAAAPTCLPMGPIGVALNGVALFNAVDAAGRDAVAHEVQDRCQGHPQAQGSYHHHGPRDCLGGTAQNNTLVGYALDGIGLYSGRDEHGREITNADLDECHGRTSPVLSNGRPRSIYHCVLTRGYPYTLGCFKGTPARARQQTGAPGQADGPGAPPGASEGMSASGRTAGRAPAEALAACQSHAANSAGQFSTPRGDTREGSCRQVRSGTADCACAPTGR
jgi:hypothetical protein